MEAVGNSQNSFNVGEQPEIDEMGELVGPVTPCEKNLNIQTNSVQKFDFEPKKVRNYIMTSKLPTEKNSLVSFEFQKKETDPDKSKIFYCEKLDRFYQLQESSNGPRMIESQCPSLMIGKRIFKSTLVYIITEYDPMFFMIPIFELIKEQAGECGYQTLEQVLEHGMAQYSSNCNDQNDNPYPDEIADKNGGKFNLATPSGSICKSSLLSLLLNSKRLRISMVKICNTKVLDPAKTNYYNFSTSKLIEHLVAKTLLIYKALNTRYEAMKNLPNDQKHKILQSQIPERKGAFDPRSRPLGTREPGAVTAVNGQELDQNILTLSSGFIIDELPKSMIQPYLKELGQFREEDVLTRNNYIQQKPKQMQQQSLSFGKRSIDTYNKSNLVINPVGIATGISNETSATNFPGQGSIINNKQIKTNNLGNYFKKSTTLKSSPIVTRKSSRLKFIKK